FLDTLLSLSFSLSLQYHPPTTTLFPYTTLFRSVHSSFLTAKFFSRKSISFSKVCFLNLAVSICLRSEPRSPRFNIKPCFFICSGDRKSTRLNSSHVSISYAVFCLKKKKHIY